MTEHGRSPPRPRASARSGVDNLTVTFVGVGTCTLTPHVAASTDYLAANGAADSFGVAQATPTPPTISNIPAEPRLRRELHRQRRDQQRRGDLGHLVDAERLHGRRRQPHGDLRRRGHVHPHAPRGGQHRLRRRRRQPPEPHRGQGHADAADDLEPPRQPRLRRELHSQRRDQQRRGASVTSSTPSVCTVGVDNLTVTFVGVGTCTLTPHVAASTDYAAADGSPRAFTVAKAAPDDTDHLEHPRRPRLRRGLHGHADARTATGRPRSPRRRRASAPSASTP